MFQILCKNLRHMSRVSPRIPVRIQTADLQFWARPVCLALAAMVALSGLETPARAAIQLPMAQPESVGMAGERLLRLDRELEHLVDQDRIAGAVALVARDGKVVHLSAVGDRYRETGDAMDVDDIFFIQSMTKSIVSAALMMLYEEGRFLLDDPISRYLPEFADKLVVREVDGRVVREPAARPVTFRHILSHTAGVDPERELLTEDEQDLLGRGDTVEETILGRVGLPLAFSPGEAWDYGTSTDYAAYLVARISGQSLDRFLEERIFGPLGMVDTGYNVPAGKTDRIVAVYSPSGPNRELELSQEPGSRPATRYFGGVNGLFSTASDYFRFAQMILNGGEFNGARILSPTTINLMTSNHVGDLPVGACVGPEGYAFGLSFAFVTDIGAAREGLTPGSFGWCGAWTTTYWIDPTERTVMILMTQLTGSGGDIRRMFPHLVMQAITGATTPGPQLSRHTIRSHGSVFDVG
jgi:CubicO group peptidase (beta-lactamase class C family)